MVCFAKVLASFWNLQVQALHFLISAIRSLSAIVLSPISFCSKKFWRLFFTEGRCVGSTSYFNTAVMLIVKIYFYSWYSLVKRRTLWLRQPTCFLCRPTSYVVLSMSATRCPLSPLRRCPCHRAAAAAAAAAAAVQIIALLIVCSSVMRDCRAWLWRLLWDWVE